MSVPTKLVAAWRRSGLILDGQRHVDHADVIWLQTPEWYADIRLRIDPTSSLPTTGAPWFYKEFSFAGPAEWNDPVITWNHVIDFSLEPTVDANPLTWVDGVAFETGKTEVDGVETVFIEEWLRMTDDDVEWSADVRDKGARIEVGNYAIEIKDARSTGGIFSSTRFHLTRTGWV
ncbi:MAG: hypothetical protein QOD72_3982, partial [Acidimicrobiaceae bacterium]|nr:hypothetical protein [Acidimicrobiaceae bacterium]